MENKNRNMGNKTLEEIASEKCFFLLPIIISVMCVIIMLGVSKMYPHGEAYGINKSNFPDKAFREYLKSQEYGQDGVITPEEIENIDEINVAKMGISDLSGIEIFSNITSLLCNDNKIQDLTGIEYLVNLEKLDCDKNEISMLNLSRNTELLELSCNFNNITELDLSKNLLLTRLECNNNQITELNLESNSKLTYIDCNTNKLKKLNISGCTDLVYLFCFDNSLSTLDVSNNLKMTNLVCHNNNLSDIDISKNVEITRYHSDFDEFYITPAKYKILGTSCSEFLAAYEEKGGSVLDGFDSDKVEVGKSDAERRAGWIELLKGFDYDLASDCQIYMLQDYNDDYTMLLLFAENDIVTSYYVFRADFDFISISQYFEETEFTEIKSLCNNSTPAIEKMIGTNKDGERWDDSNVCRLVFQENDYSVQFQAGKFDVKTGETLTDWNKMWFVGFYVAYSPDSANQLNSGGDIDQSSAKDSAKSFFSNVVGDYDDLHAAGSIMVMEVMPSSDNNFANYLIVGRGFSGIYDTDCIEADDSIQRWIFESNGYYYMIVEGLDGYYIYYDTSRERLSESSECCGIFSTYVEVGSNAVENDITVKNFEQKVSLRKGNSGITDYAMEAYKQEIDESGSPYTFTYKYIGECSDGFYYYNGEDLTFNVYRITYKDGGQSIYFMPLNVGENMVWELYENYYELIYRWTQY